MSTTTAEPVMDYDEALRRFDPVHGPRGPRRAQHRAPRCSAAAPTGVRRRAEQPGLPGLPRPARRAAGGQRQGGRVGDPDRPGAQLRRSPTWCRFARKNYFYPDMPKNFQTSQYDEPIAFDGYLDVELEDGTTYRVEIERAHMEEDTGKSLHVGGATGRIHGADYSLVDYNRAGIPLIEIVTKPLDRARGSGRPRWPRPTSPRCASCCGPSASATSAWSRARCAATPTSRCGPGRGRRPAAQDAVPLGTRTETKNVNSLRSVERAVRYEITRHAAILAGGGSILQETRHWHEDTGVTTSGRPKSDADDYRYFPEPDLVPVAPDARRGSRSCAARCPSRRRSAAGACSRLGLLRPRDARRRQRRRGRAHRGQPSPPAPPRPAPASGGPARSPAAPTSRPATSRTSGSRRQHVAELDAMVSAGRLNDSMARQVLDGVLAGEGSPLQVADARGPGGGQRRRRARRRRSRPSSRPTRTWRRRSATARCRRPARSSARS